MVGPLDPGDDRDPQLVTSGPGPTIQDVLLQTPTVMTKKIRRRIYNVTGRLVRTGRRLVLRLPRRWPWAGLITAALERLRALPAASG